MNFQQLLNEQEPHLLKFHAIEAENGLVPDLALPLDSLVHRNHQFLIRLYVYRLLEELIEAEMESTSNDKRLLEVADVLIFGLDLAILTGARHFFDAATPPCNYFEWGSRRIRQLSHDLLQMLQNKSYRPTQRQTELDRTKVHVLILSIITITVRGLGHSEEEVIEAFYRKRGINTQRLSESGTN